MVPALNEAESIRAVVEGARSVLAAPVVVVDDGSTDATSDLARAAGATVLPLPFNLGVGGAIRTGIHYAVDHGYRCVVQLDGDGQHEPSEAKRLLEALEHEQADMVVGSRFAAGYAVSWHRRVAMRWLSWLVSRRLGTRLTDTTSGFRAMGPRALDLFARDYPLDYLSDTVEALLIAADAGLRVVEVDVVMHNRQGGRPSANRLSSAFHLTRLLLVIFLHSLRRRSGPA